MAKNAHEVTVANRRLKLSNLDKVMYPGKPGSGGAFTKGEVIDYYANVSDALIPHLKGRPLTTVRWPDGVQGGSFFEKRSPKHRPDWVKTAAVAFDRAGEIDFTLCDNKPTLVWLAQLASLELHPSLSRASRMESPTVLAFDLDPGPPADIVDCCKTALKLRGLFREFGLEMFPKSSGSKGMQVYVPLNRPSATYEKTGPFAKAVAMLLEKEDPKRWISSMARKDRKGKVFLDWSQNNRSKTTVAVYSLRAKERPTCSTPLLWDEVERTAKDGKGERLVFEAPEVLKRIEKHGDLFEPVLKLKQSLPKLDGLPEE